MLSCNALEFQQFIQWSSLCMLDRKIFAYEMSLQSDKFILLRHLLGFVYITVNPN